MLFLKMQIASDSHMLKLDLTPTEIISLGQRTQGITPKGYKKEHSIFPFNLYSLNSTIAQLLATVLELKPTYELLT